MAASDQQSTPNVATITPKVAAITNSGQRRGYPRYLLPAYALLIVYVSLSPFSAWQAPDEPLLQLLVARWPRYITAFDLFANVLAYLPLGILLFDVPRKRWGRVVALGVAVLGGVLLSLIMETAQAFLPMRISSPVDLLANGSGALLGGISAAYVGRTRLIRALIDWRHRTFNEGAGAEFGEVLLAVWLFVQLNPSIPFFAAGTIDNPLLAEWNARGVEPLYLLPQGLAVALNVCGFGLFISVLLQPPVRAVRVVLGVIACGALLKLLAAGVLLKPPLQLDWFGADTLAGIAGGMALLWAVVRLSHRKRIYLAAMLILAGGLLAKIAAIYNAPSITLGVFSWPYGQLFNFTSLTRLLNEFWPVVALIYLCFGFNRLPSSDAGSASI